MNNAEQSLYSAISDYQHADRDSKSGNDREIWAWFWKAGHRLFFFFFKNVTYNVYCSSAMRNLSWKRCEKEEAVLFRCLISASDWAFLSSYNYVKQLMIYLSCVKYVVLKYLI